MRVLFVCRGNRSRSQIAEAFFRKFYPQHSVLSAGTVALHSGEALPEYVIRVLKEEGIDASDHRVKKVTSEMIESSDRVIVLCSKKECPNFLVQSSKVEYWNVEDPEYQGEKALRHSVRVLKERVRSLSP